MAVRLRHSLRIESAIIGPYVVYNCSKLRLTSIKTRKCKSVAVKMSSEEVASCGKVIDSHLHVWASPQEAEDKYPYFPGQEPRLAGHAEYLLECMENARVEGALIVQPINHKFDHSYVTSVLRRYPAKFGACCLANPASDTSGIKQLEDLVTKDGFCAVRFNPYLWPSGEKMTNETGKALFSKAGELSIPVSFMCIKGLSQHVSEIEELCTEYPSTTVILDHLGFCKPPISDEENAAFLNLLELSRFPQVHVKLSALFRVSREPYPYKDVTLSLSQVVSKYGANRIMWGSDFPFVVPECGYELAKTAVSVIAKAAKISSVELDWILGGTAMKLFSGQWATPVKG